MLSFYNPDAKAQGARLRRLANKIGGDLGDVLKLLDQQAKIKRTGKIPKLIRNTKGKFEYIAE